MENIELIGGENINNTNAAPSEISCNMVFKLKK